MATAVVQKGYEDRCVAYEWESLNNGETGEAVEAVGPRGISAAFQVQGTFAGSTVELQGTCNGSNYRTLKDVYGNNIVLSASGLVELSSSCHSFRVRCQGGSASGLRATLMMRG